MPCVNLSLTHKVTLAVDLNIVNFHFMALISKAYEKFSFSRYPHLSLKDGPKKFFVNYTGKKCRNLSVVVSFTLLKNSTLSDLDNAVY